MTGKLIAVANMKGGVGKTTTVVSLAEALSADDMTKNVLVVDLDPQASASLSLAGDDILTEIIEGGRTVQDFFELALAKQRVRVDVRSYIHPRISTTTHGGEQLRVALLPCGPRLRMLERSMIYELTKHHSLDALEKVLKKVLDQHMRPLTDIYDYVIFDCPPSISPISEVAIRGSDLIIVPSIPDRISNYGLNSFCANVLTQPDGKRSANMKPYVLITRRPLTRQANDMVERLQVEANASDAAFRLFVTVVPQCAALANAITSGTVGPYLQKYGPIATPVLADLVREVKGAL